MATAKTRFVFFIVKSDFFSKLNFLRIDAQIVGRYLVNQKRF